MTNRIPSVRRLEYAMRRGWPEGTTELYREIPMLLARIEELENALAPFARVWQAESRVPNIHPDKLVNVYVKHCVQASDMLDPAKGAQPEVDNFFSLPAE